MKYWSILVFHGPVKVSVVASGRAWRAGSAKATQGRRLRLSRKAKHALRHPLAGSNTLQPELESIGVDWTPELPLLLGEDPQIEDMEHPGQSE